MIAEKFRLPLVSAALLALSLAACGPAETPDEEGPEVLQTLAVAEDGTLSVTLLAPRSLAVGRNVVTYLVEDLASGAPVEEAALTHLPMMHMMDKSHSCPFIEPAPLTGEAGRFRGEIVFNMAGGEMGRWDTTVTIVTGGESREVVFSDLTVTESDARRDLVIDVAGGTESYIVNLDFEAAPKVGLNPFVISVHRRMGMMSFPAQIDLAISVAPEMPTMGHGSSGNIDPVHVSDGNYAGTVNLTMPGYWTIDFTIRRGGETLGTVRWDVTL